MLSPSPPETDFTISLQHSHGRGVCLKKGDDEGTDGEEVGQTEGASSRFLALFLKSNLR